MMIDIDHVSFQYSGAEQENLQDFNLQIKKGECVVLTGESGCGKTCVTRLINTLIPHFYEGEMSGAVLIDGVDTRTIQPHDLSDKIGSVFQNPRSQFFSLDTDSEIVFGMENKGMPYQVMLDRYQQTIRELHIEKLKDRNLFDLSGGQKQTIAFASVYALNPDIFVLDEPSSNLDPEAIQELRRLLLLIKAQGKTIVVSEHRLYFLNGIADRIVLMEHGIGVAALRDAEVLIFDEPTSGLDYKNMESVAGILSALSKRGKAILVISHDNELLMKICSRVIRMDEKTSS